MKKPRKKPKKKHPKKPRVKTNFQYWEDEPFKIQFTMWACVFIPAIIWLAYCAIEEVEEAKTISVTGLSLMISAFIAFIVLKVLGYNFKPRDERGEIIK